MRINALFSDGPGETVWLLPCRKLSRHFQSFQVDDRNVIIGRAGDKRARAVGLHKNAGGTAADPDALGLFASAGVEDSQIRRTERRDKDQLSVWRKFQAVGAVHVGVQRLYNFFAGDVDNRNGSILRVGNPDFFAIRRNVEAL
jgi:hypothetical protein